MKDFFIQIFSSIIAGKLTNFIGKPKIENNVNINIAIDREIDKCIPKQTNLSESNEKLILAIKSLKRIYTDKSFTSAKIASDLNIESIAQVERIISGRITPTLSFVRKFSNKYNINEEWLLSGDHNSTHIYSHCCNYTHDAKDIPSIYKDGQYTSMYVCTADNDERWTCLVLVKPDTFSVYHCQTNWRISGNVGAGGQMQLRDLHKTLSYFNSYSLEVGGLRVSSEEFNKLISGELHITELKQGKQINYMWEDLLDINRTNMGNIDYEQKYGKEFINAQIILNYVVH